MFVFALKLCEALYQSSFKCMYDWLKQKLKKKKFIINEIKKENHLEKGDR